MMAKNYGQNVNDPRAAACFKGMKGGTMCAGMGHNSRPITKVKPNASAPLGEGGRFAALEAKLDKRPSVTNPGALAAYIGRKKYGKSRFQKLAAKGR